MHRLDKNIPIKETVGALSVLAKEWKNSYYCRLWNFGSHLIEYKISFAD